MPLLCNRDISHMYSNCSLWLFRSDVIAAFAYWIVIQSPYPVPYLTMVLKDLDKYFEDKFPSKKDVPTRYYYENLRLEIQEGAWQELPRIQKLNTPREDGGQDILFTSGGSEIPTKYDFIDLCALARNVFYMIVREQLTTGSVEMPQGDEATNRNVLSETEEEEEWGGSGFLSDSSGPI